MRTSMHVGGRAGTDWWKEWGRRIRFFHQLEEQRWTPLMSEVRDMWGLRFFGFEIAISKRYRVWKDGREPSTEKLQ